MAKFALIGAGYIHTRHVNAITSLGHQLVLAMDTTSTAIEVNGKLVEVLNSEEEFFEQVRHQKIDWISICSPTFEHQKQVIKSLQAGCNVIVEKPICLAVQEVEGIQLVEKQTGKKVFSLFQLRYHPNAQQIGELKQEQNSIQICYRGVRDSAYFQTWKGNVEQSGGILAAVGLHYFDLLIENYGGLQGDVKVIEHNNRYSIGMLNLQQATLRWDVEFLSEELQEHVYRSFFINDTELDFSTYSSDLHTLAYEEILNGNGVDTATAKQSIQLLEAIRNA